MRNHTLDTINKTEETVQYVKSLRPDFGLQSGIGRGPDRAGRHVLQRFKP